MMGDTCICVDVEQEFADYDEQTVTDADTEHRCEECRRTIPKGAPHVVHTFMREEPECDADGEQLDDEIWEEGHRECILCARVRRSLVQCGWYIGCVWSMIRDHMEYMMPLEEGEEDDDSWLDPPTKPIGCDGL